MDASDYVDVLIVGAGLSGICAARRLPDLPPVDTENLVFTSAPAVVSR